MVAELAIAMILLVSAGLLGKSLYRLLHVDPGFNVQQLALLSVSPVSVASGSPNGDEQPGRLAQQVAERVAAVPGVMSAGYADLSPLAPGLARASTLWIPGRAEHEQLKDSARSPRQRDVLPSDGCAACCKGFLRERASWTAVCL